MTFALILVVTAALCVAMADFIRKVPLLFYALAVATVVVFAAGACNMIDGTWWKPLVLLVRRCMVALALFVVVMFIGVLPKDSKLGLRMRSVRAEISITACILCLGHACIYLAPYATRALTGSLQANMMMSFVVALALFAMLLILGVTSLGFVKKHMHARMWKRVQVMAYPFFLLTYVHLMLMLAPSAMIGSTASIVGILVYSVVFAAYLALRIRRFAVDRKSEVSAAAARSSAIAA